MEKSFSESLAEQIQKLLNMPFVQSRDSWIETGRLLLNRAKDKSFQIVVVGEFSSGKSTFVNALIGKDILAHASEETTAVLTRLINVPKTDPRCNTAVVLMKDGTEQTVKPLTRENLMKYTTKISQKFAVEKVVDYVNLYIPILDNDTDFMIVDTPGLNGMAPGLREQTERMVQEAHACIYLIPRHGLSKSDIEFLTWLTKYQKNFIFIQNFLDSFQKEEGDTFENRKEEIKSILEEHIQPSNPDLNYQICGVSSLYELHRRDPSVSIEGLDMAGQGVNNEVDNLGFGDFRTVLHSMLDGDNARRIKYGDTARAVAEWCEDMLRTAGHRQQQVQEAYEVSREKDVAQKLEATKKAMAKDKSKQEDALAGFVISSCRNLSRQAAAQFAEQINELEKKYAKKVENVSTVDELEKQAKYLPNSLAGDVADLCKDSEKYLGIKLDDLYQLIRERIEEYIGIKSIGLKLDTFHLKSISKDNLEFQNTFGIESAERKKEELDRKLSGQTLEQSKLREKISEQKSDLQTQENTLQSVERKKVKDLSNLGQRPDVEIKYRTERYRRKRKGIFSWLTNPLFGDKEDTRTVEVRDDSAQREWDKNRAKINNNFIIEKNSLLSNIDQIKGRISDLELQKQYAEEEIHYMRRQMQEIKENIAKLKELRSEAMQKARAAYLRSYKKHRKDEIHAYLFGTESREGLTQRVQRQIKDAVDKETDNIKKEALTEFDKSYQQKMLLLDEAIQKDSPKLQKQIENLEENRKELQSVMDTLKGWIA